MASITHTASGADLVDLLDQEGESDEWRRVDLDLNLDDALGSFEKLVIAGEPFDACLAVADFLVSCREAVVKHGV